MSDLKAIMLKNKRIHILVHLIKKGYTDERLRNHCFRSFVVTSQTARDYLKIAKLIAKSGKNVV